MPFAIFSLPFTANSLKVVSSVMRNILLEVYTWISIDWLHNFASVWRCLSAWIVLYRLVVTHAQFWIWSPRMTYSHNIAYIIGNFLSLKNIPKLVQILAMSRINYPYQILKIAQDKILVFLFLVVLTWKDYYS